MTRNEFIQKAAIAFRTNGAGAAEAWAEASKLADAAPVGTFDAPRNTPATTSGASGGAVFPNFGKSKGAPVMGATQNDLRFYAGAALRTLADPEKQRFHDKERAQLALYAAELERQGFDAREFKGPPKIDATRAQMGGQATADADELPPF